MRVSESRLLSEAAKSTIALASHKGEHETPIRRFARLPHGQKGSAGVFADERRGAVRLEYCVEFIELARRLNFTEAANELHLAQSTLSKHISELESELGAKLFVRQHDGARLTEEGYAFFNCATSMVGMYEDTKRTIALMNERDVIRIDGQLDDSALSALMSAAIMLNNDDKRIPIRFNRNRTKGLYDLLSDGDVDIVLTGEAASRLEDSDFSYRPLLENPFGAILESDHPLAARSEIRMADLHNETFVQFLDEFSAPGWRCIEEVCRAHGFVPKRRPVLTQSSAEQLSIPLNGCIAIFPRALKLMRFLSSTSRRVCVPVVDDDAVFRTYCVYKPENEQRLAPFLETLELARDLIDRPRG